MLQKLLASRNPDDLRAANRLIREMVRRVSQGMPGTVLQLLFE